MDIHLDFKASMSGSPDESSGKTEDLENIELSDIIFSEKAPHKGVAGFIVQYSKPVRMHK